MSQKSREAICAILAQHYTEVRITLVDNFLDLKALVARKPDLVFLGMKFVPMNHVLGMEDPDKVWISQYLDEHNIAYTGSCQVAHELELNKPLAKQRVLKVGLNTSPFYVARQNQPLKREDIVLAFPLFVKPTNRGGGLGIAGDSLVHTFQQLQSKVRSITANVHSDSLIEEYLSGREFSVAILKEEFLPGFLAMPIEKIAPLNKHGERVLSEEIKLADSVHDAKVTDKAIRAKLIELAIRAFHALGARDYGRIDIRLDETGTPHFLEANLIPSLIKGYGSFPKACVMNIHLDQESMILRIAELALSRGSTIPEITPTRNPILPSLEPVA